MSSVVNITQAVKSAPNSKDGLDIQGVEEENRLNSSDATDKIIAASLSQPPADKDTSLGNIDSQPPADKDTSLGNTDSQPPADKDISLGNTDSQPPADKDTSLGNTNSQPPVDKDTSLGNTDSQPPADKDIILGNTDSQPLVGETDTLTGEQGTNTSSFEYFLSQGKTFMPVASVEEGNPLELDRVTDLNPGEHQTPLDTYGANSSARALYDATSGLVYYNPSETPGNEVPLMQLNSGLNLNTTSFEIF